MVKASLDPGLVTAAAAGLVDHEGLGALTLKRLAELLGVASPSLYKHVAGLDDLRVRVTTWAIRDMNDGLTAAAMGRSGRAALFAVAHAYRRYAVAHPGLYSLMQGAPDPASPEQRFELARALAIITAITASFGVPMTRSVHAIRLVRSALHGFVDIEARGGFDMPQSIDDSFDLLVGALSASICHLGQAC